MQKILHPKCEIDPPKVPLDYAWARKLGLIRRPAAFVSSITDERGEELSYAGMKVGYRISKHAYFGRRFFSHAITFASNEKGSIELFRLIIAADFKSV